MTSPRTTPEDRERRRVAEVFRSESIGGAVALLAAVVALVWANLDGAGYAALQHHALGPLTTEEWAADGALALFFFVAGLELKREMTVGALRRVADAAVPAVAAACGVAVPALIYLVVNAGTDNLRGWAIPAATDIAFAVAVLAVVGSSLPGALRTFLLTLAVVDDLIVIVVIAVFYSGSVDALALLGAVLGCVTWAVCQRLRLTSAWVLVPVAVLTWSLLHASGVHATVAGVALGLLTRVRADDGEDDSPADRFQHRLEPVSAWLAVPFFALLSAGVDVGSLDGSVSDPLVVGVVIALVVGKPVGILLGIWGTVRTTGARLDPALGRRHLVGVAALGGIGFTVSLLVADLSFDDSRVAAAKAAVLVASVVAAALGAVLLAGRRK